MAFMLSAYGLKVVGSAAWLTGGNPKTKARGHSCLAFIFGLRVCPSKTDASQALPTDAAFLEGHAAVH
jgi:hypothetical protein